MAPDETNDEFIQDSDDYVDVYVGIAQWQLPDGRHIVEKDFKVSGEVWRVHKNDADPYPSNPHAHCVGGAKRFIGCTLHLGTGDLFKERKALGRRLESNQFSRLIELIRPKFPGITFPLKS